MGAMSLIHHLVLSVFLSSLTILLMLTTNFSSYVISILLTLTTNFSSYVILVLDMYCVIALCFMFYAMTVTIIESGSLTAAV